MKKYFLLLAAVATVFAASCTREAELNQVRSQEQGNNHLIPDDVPMPVVFTAQYAAVKAAPIATKGVGAIDDWKGAAQPKLYISGFRFDRKEQGVNSVEWIDIADSLLYNVGAYAPDASSDSEGIRLDGSQRSKISLYNAQAVGGKATKEPYFYREGKDREGNAIDKDIAFSFFGYYVDDAATHFDEFGNPAPVVTLGSATYDAEGNLESITSDGSIVINDLKLNGTQDIMLATTDKEVDALARSRYIDQETYYLTELTADDLGEYVEPSRIYSAHSARRGINPDLVFTHELSRFTFWVKKGGSVPSSDITITSLEVFDFVEGDLTVLGGKSGVEGRGLVAQETDITKLVASWKNDIKIAPSTDEALTKYVKPLYVQDADNNGQHILSEADAVHPYEKDYGKLGNSILVYPGRDTLHMVIQIKQVGASAPGYCPYKLHIPIVIGEDQNGLPLVAEKGKNYNVKLTVYGLEDVRVSVSLTEWDQADIFVDTDPDDEDLREPATIALGSNYNEVENTNTPFEQAYKSLIGDSTTQHYEEVETLAAAGYANPDVRPVAHLTIRSNDVYDLLDTAKFVKDNTPAGGHYADPGVLAFVRSNSTGVFHFEASSTEFFELEGSKIVAKKEGDATITVRQNISNDFLAAISRQIAVHIVPDNRVPVEIVAGDKNMEIANEEGAYNTLDMFAHFKFKGLEWVVNHNPETGYWDALWKYEEGENKELTTDDRALYESFDLAFKVVEGESVRVDAETGVITALKAGASKVEITFKNMKNDDTYRDCVYKETLDKNIALADTVTVTVGKLAITDLGLEDSYTVAYGESITFKPVLPNGAGKVIYSIAGADAEFVALDEAAGIVKGRKPTTAPVTVTVTVEANTLFGAFQTTVPVNVIKAQPVIKASGWKGYVAEATKTYTLDVDYVIESEAGNHPTTAVFTSNNTAVFTVDAATGEVTPIGAGNATLTISVAGNANFEDASVEVHIAIADRRPAATIAAAEVNAVVGAADVTPAITVNGAAYDVDIHGVYEIVTSNPDIFTGVDGNIHAVGAGRGYMKIKLTGKTAAGIPVAGVGASESAWIKVTVTE